MGQQIAVVAKPSPNAGVLRFEANRNLTGMGHELFRTAAEAVGPRPAAKLARTLLEAGGVDTVHIYGNMITVDLAKGANGSGVADAIRDLYQYWKPGMELPVFEDVVAEAAPAAAAGDAGESGGVESEYTRRVPAHLIERSQAGLAKWKANHGG